MGSFVSRPSVGEARADMDTLRREELVLEAVSYTHLTLPTKA